MNLPLLLEMLKRIACAAFCGACIGMERDVHGRAAGLRTHILVAAGSALFTIVSLLVAAPQSRLLDSLVLTGDAGRIAAQIVTGIGFMGAGTIVKSGFTIRGLTTSACLWYVAALGMACGINQLPVAVFCAIAGLLIIFIGKKLEKSFHRLFPFTLTVEAKSLQDIETIKNYLQDQPNFNLTTLNLQTAEQQKNVKAFFYIDAYYPQKQQECCLELVRTLWEKIPGLISVSYQSEG